MKDPHGISSFIGPLDGDGYFGHHQVINIFYSVSFWLYCALGDKENNFRIAVSDKHCLNKYD